MGTYQKGRVDGLAEEKVSSEKLVNERLGPLLKALHQLHPEVLEERKHEYNGDARNYWYLGYIAALVDTRTALRYKAWPIDAADPRMIDLPDDDA